MGIPPSSQFSGSPSPTTQTDQSLLVNNNTEVVPTPNQITTQAEYVYNSTANHTAVNTDRNSDVVRILRGFAEGTPRRVTYYHRRDMGGNVHGITKVIDDELHRVHASYLKILNFELRFVNAMQFSHLTEDQIYQYTGEALTYPGFEPLPGDRFIMEVDTGRFGLFEIREIPERLSIRASSYYKIGVILTDILTEAFIKVVEDAVTDVAYFDKQRFLLGDTALLTTTEANSLGNLAKVRKRLIKFYRTQFYEYKIYESFIHETYDPYVVEFMNRIIDYGEMGAFPRQLRSADPYLGHNLFAALIEPESAVLSAVPNYFEIRKNEVGTYSVKVNALMNKNYLCLGKTPEDGIPADQNYQTRVLGAPTGALSVLVLHYINTGDIDVTAVLAEATAVIQEAPAVQFYKIPILIFLAQKAIANLHGNSGGIDIF